MVRWLMTVTVVLVGLSQLQAQVPQPTSYAPDKVIQLDLKWMSPPTVLPANGGGSAQQQDNHIRLIGKTAGFGHSFTWPLRYPINVPQYSVLVLRYRAQNLGIGNDYADRVLRLNLQKDGQDLPAVVAVSLSELVQDGTLHEIRKELSGAANDAEIEALQFTFHPNHTGGAQLDIFEIRFERGFVAPAAPALVQQPVDFTVSDPHGRAVADAEVHVGLLERANWAAVGRTDAFGRIRLSTILPATASHTPAVQAEAAVLREGYLPQYVAPIEFPMTAPLAVKLATPAVAQQQQLQQLPADQAPAPEAQPLAQVPDGVIYAPPTTYVYESASYGYQWGAPFYYVTPAAPSWWVPPHCVRPPRHHDRDPHRDGYHRVDPPLALPDRDPRFRGRTGGEPQRPREIGPAPTPDVFAPGPIRAGEPRRPENRPRRSEDQRTVVAPESSGFVREEGRRAAEIPPQALPREDREQRRPDNPVLITPSRPNNADEPRRPDTRTEQTATPRPRQRPQEQPQRIEIRNPAPSAAVAQPAPKRVPAPASAVLQQPHARPSEPARVEPVRPNPPAELKSEGRRHREMPAVTEAPRPAAAPSVLPKVEAPASIPEPARRERPERWASQPRITPIAPAPEPARVATPAPASVTVLPTPAPPTAASASPAPTDRAAIREARRAAREARGD